MEDFLTEIKLFYLNLFLFLLFIISLILSKRFIKQLTASIKSSQDDANRRLEKIENQLEMLIRAFVKSRQNYNESLSEYDEMVTKRLENVVIGTKTYYNNQTVNSSKRLDIKSSRDDMKKKMEDGLEAKMYNKSQEEILSERMDKQLIVFMKLFEEKIRKKLEESNNAYNEIQAEILEPMEQHFLNDSMASDTTQFSSDEDVEVAQEAFDELSNKDVNTQGTKKRQFQINNFAPEESQGNSNEYQRIIFYIKQNLKVMILLRGLPGSGKSYLANKLLQDSLGIVKRSKFIFNPHKHLLQNDHITDEDLEAAHLANKRKCFTAVKNDISPVIVDSNNLQIEDMRVYCLMAAQNGYIIKTVQVNTPWALDISVLAKINTLRLDEEEIQMMLESYQRNVSSYYLLKELGLNHE